MKHVYDINFRMDLGGSNGFEQIDKILSEINETFQMMSGSSDKLVLTVPFSMTMTTDRKLSTEETEELTKHVRDTAKKTKLRFESIRYVGVK